MDWQRIEKEIKKLAIMINTQPDIIVAVIRGGLIPARLLAKHLSIKDMFALTVKKVDDERKIFSSVEQNLTGIKVLLVEDVLESGKSIIVAREYLESLGAHVTTASLYYQPHTELVPTYSLGEIKEVPIFPWD